MNRLWKLLILIILAVLITGCTLLNLRKDNTFSKDSCLIKGEIYTKEATKKPLVVVAYSIVDGKAKIAHHTVLREPGPYELLVPGGRYWVFAFEDANQNLILDQNEMAGIALGDSADEAIDAPAGGLVSHMVIVLSRNPDISRKLPADVLVKHTGGNFKWHATQAGEIMDINDPVFSAEQGRRGFWSPFEFFRELGANIYFLEPYDDRKIPVLCVHGAAGSPQDWRYFIDHIDRSRYQIWIYYYPSGARLKAMSELMSTKINELHQKYEFERLYVLAHSMGGHVARYALVHQSALKSYVKLFVSISTPFGGEELAKTGVEKSPAVIPSWKDMVPDSEFIKHSFSGNMPYEIKYYLFFGHKGNRNPLRPNNDSTVTMESMLDTRAQSEAIKVFGFNEDHISILNSPDVLARYKDILGGVEKEYTTSDQICRKGKIRFRYILEEASDAPPLWMTMMFIPADISRAEFMWSPDPLKTDQEIGPMNGGVYDVGLLAWGYKASPASVKADVGAERVPEFTLSLKPQGMVGGQITMELKKDDRYWGFLPSLAVEKKITAISLTGKGVGRKIVPYLVNLGDAMRDVMKGKDYFWKDFFIFFDIPKGQYELKVEAQGCEPVVQAVTVDPKIIHAPLKISLCK